MKVAPIEATALNSAGQAELFRAARAQLVIAREARDKALATDNDDVADEHWNRCDVAREDLCAALGLLEDAGVLEALSGLIQHIGEL